MALQQIKGVVECNENGAQAVMIIAETKETAAEAENAYCLSAHSPETEETIDDNGVRWKNRIYVFGDDGGGIVYYERAPLL